MNISLKIAKAELRTLFYSPIAWFLTIIFIFQAALAFTGKLQESLTKQELGGYYLDQLGFLTNAVFGIMGIFGDLAKKVYLYIPLLTMGLISRETSSGTIKLLYSSPVTVKQIVYGKFLAMVAYSFLLTLVMCLFVITGTMVIQSADTSTMFVGLLGFFLILCTYAAIGLFMSCLTTYQVVAALSTLVVFAILSYIGTVWQEIDFVRGLTYFLSISTRADRMFVGYISSKDVVYFVVITAMFLSFSMFKLQGERASVSTGKTFLKYILSFVACLFIGYLSSRPRFIISYDATAVKFFTLHPNVEKIMKEFGDEPIEVTTYVNLVDIFVWEGLPKRRNIDLDRWEPYLRVKNNISLKYVYYYDYPGEEQGVMASNPGKTLKEIAEQAAKTFDVDLGDFKTPEEIGKIVDLRTENNSYVMQLKYKGKSTFLRLFSDPGTFPAETEVAAAMKRLLVPVPKIVFVESELERGRDPKAEGDYGILTNGLHERASLMNQGFDTESISLIRQEIPAGIAALVIADPRKDFSPQSVAKIQQYINKGGNLLIATEPGKQSVFNPLLKILGIQIMDGQLVQNDELLNGGKPKIKLNGPSMSTVGVQMDENGNVRKNKVNFEMVKPFLTKAAAVESRYFNKAFRDSAFVSMQGAVALSYAGHGDFEVIPVLTTDKNVSWLKKGKLETDSATLSFSATDGDVRGSFSTLLALKRKVNGKEQRIIVSGDADFLSNKGIFFSPFRNAQANEGFGTGIFSWFTYNQFPVDTRHVEMKDNRLTITVGGLKKLKIIYMGILPGILLLTGMVFLLRRKRK